MPFISKQSQNEKGKISELAKISDNPQNQAGSKMKKSPKQVNIEKFEKFLTEWLAKDWSAFKPLAIQGSLSRTKVSAAAKIDLNALKRDKGNPVILKAFDELEKLLQINLPDHYIPKQSSLEKYHDYIEKLESEGGKFPIDTDGDIDVIRLGRNIGIPTARFSSPGIKKHLDDDIRRIGTEVVKGKSVEERMEDNLIYTSSELSKCRKDLALAEKKNEGLTKQNLELQSTVRKLEQQSDENDESLEHAISTGRRWAI
jgi:hypothetical protein